MGKGANRVGDFYPIVGSTSLPSIILHPMICRSTKMGRFTMFRILHFIAPSHGFTIAAVGFALET